MAMTFKDWMLQAEESELMKVASALKTSLENQINNSITPLFHKVAEELTEQVQKNIGAHVEAQQANEVTKLNAQGQVNDMVLPETGKTIDKNQLKEALEEAILANNPKGLAQVIAGVLQVAGEDAASNAISVARTILQDALVSGKLEKDQIQVLAQAFTVFEGGENE